MADKFDRKLRNKAKMYLAGNLAAHVFAMICYLPAWIMMGQNQMGFVVGLRGDLWTCMLGKMGTFEGDSRLSRARKHPISVFSSRVEQ